MSDIPSQKATPVDETTMTNLIDVVRKYVNERLIPLEPKISEEDKIPEEVVQEMRDLGLFGLTIPQEYGNWFKYRTRMSGRNGVRSDFASLQIYFRH